MFLVKQLFFIVKIFMQKAELYYMTNIPHLDIVAVHGNTDTSEWQTGNVDAKDIAEHVIKRCHNLPSVEFSNKELMEAFLVVDDHHGQRESTYTLAFWYPSGRFMSVEFTRKDLDITNNLSGCIFQEWCNYLLAEPCMEEDDKLIDEQPLFLSMEDALEYESNRAEEAAMEKRMQKGVIDLDDCDFCEVCGNELESSTVRNGYKTCGRC